MAFTGGHLLFYDRWLFHSQFYSSPYFKIMKMENTVIKPAAGRTGNTVSSHEGTKPTGNLFYPNLKFLTAGILFGILLIKGEVVSWFRIQEMFRFQNFHMYGIMGSA